MTGQGTVYQMWTKPTFYRPLDLGDALMGTRTQNEAIEASVVHRDLAWSSFQLVMRSDAQSKELVHYR